MHHKLFYKDAYITTFSTRVLQQNSDESGHHYVLLEETAFYPAGGGQPHDTGTLNGVQVINVEEIDGEIRHFIQDPLPNTKNEIQGEINWERRFDHMQQHTGQHILSAAFEELFNISTVGFHLGKETVTIDLDADITEEQVLAAEEKANTIILANLPIETKWVSSEELSQYPMRKQPSVTEDIRLVIIPGFDYNGCGGTHPDSTGEVSAIKILGLEKQRNKVRLEFVCGKRVLRQLHQKHQAISKLTELLNSPEATLAAAAERLLNKNKEMEKAAEVAKDQLLSFEARELIKDNCNGAVFKSYKNRPVQDMQRLARIITAEEDNLIVFITAENENGLQMVCARGKTANGSMKKIAAAVLPEINGRGGGSDMFAQGGGEAVISGEQLLERLQKELK
nr:alanyl-tRNA editing protein [Mesobacillus harenae]